MKIIKITQLCLCWMTPRVLTQRCQYHRLVLTQRCQLHRWVSTHWCQWHRWVMAQDHMQKLIFIDSAASLTLLSFDWAIAVSLTPPVMTQRCHPRFDTRRSWRISTFFQNYFRVWIRVLGRCFMEKNRNSKISWDCPFKLTWTHWCWCWWIFSCDVISPNSIGCHFRYFCNKKSVQNSTWKRSMFLRFCFRIINSWFVSCHWTHPVTWIRASMVTFRMHCANLSFLNPLQSSCWMQFGIYEYLSIYIK